MSPTDDAQPSNFYSPGQDANDIMPYVDQGPEIIARDHAPDPARIDATLKEAGRPASERWSARMHASRTEQATGHDWDGTSSGGNVAKADLPQWEAAALDAESRQSPYLASPLNSDPIMQGSWNTPAGQPLPPSIPSVDVPVR